ncbi:MAG: efflux RND transporter periplasmic adaptor subunit [Deltaproteobacteria bacterium]|nr:efflux RND transporter periplasmic adaptor subunit [Deltaproteobacteria bacterium]
MKRVGRKLVVSAVLLLGTAGLIWAILGQTRDGAVPSQENKASRPAPVEVAEIRQGPIVLRRTFSGALEALAEFVAAPKVSGRVKRMVVNIADRVARGQVVAELDNAEYVQAVAQAQADLVVARANLAKAKSALDTSVREFKRTKSLRERGIASDSEFDAVEAEHLAKQVQLEVAEAEVTKAESSLETANIRLGYTKVTADWSGGDEHRVVAERYLDEGQTIAANEPLLLIVDLSPIIGVFFVAERDYAHLKPGQIVSLTTDAYPSELFQGRIERIAPVFRESTRQARVEMIIENPQHRLKPGMFIRATVEMDKVSETTIVPEGALTARNNQSGVFVVSKDGNSVTWRAVQVGIREGEWVQVEGDGLQGRVVTLGQQLIDDGSKITIPAARGGAVSEGTKADTR